MLTTINITEVTELLETLNNADPTTVWDDVINPRLTPAEHDLITTDMRHRGTFIHHNIPYGRSRYTHAWTVLLHTSDLDPTDRPKFNWTALDRALNLAHQRLRSTHPHVFPVVHRCAG